MSRQVCGNCLCPYGDDGQCACVEDQVMTTEAGIIYLSNRWSGDTHSDKDTGCVDVEATERLIVKQAAELKRLRDYDTRLTAVMPADFKDWRENSEREWPELAAWVITNLREQRDEANAEIEHLKFALNQESLARENVSQMRAEFASKLDKSEALLRQALDAMQWEVGGAPLPTLMMESIAAIKQHLEGKQ